MPGVQTAFFMVYLGTSSGPLRERTDVKPMNHKGFWNLERIQQDGIQERQKSCGIQKLLFTPRISRSSAERGKVENF